MFWRVRSYFPLDERFSAENFGYQPTWLIFQALEWGQKLHFEQLHLNEYPVASMAALFANTKRDPQKSEPFTRDDFFCFKPPDPNAVKISATVADAFFSLIRDRLLPEWALALAPVDQLTASRGDGSFSGCRAWIGDGVVIVLPKVVGNLVKGAIAIVESNGGVVDCLNVDTKEHHAIDLTGFEGWVFEPEYEIIPSLIELI